MAGQIFIEADEVELAGLPSGAMHLYLVFRDTDGAEYVIRSGPQNPYTPWFGEMRIEANTLIGESVDDRGSESPAERASTALDFAGLTDDEAWAVMVKYARMLQAADYPYEVLGVNSNAFVGAMLAAAGGDPLAMLPEGVTRTEALGVSNYRDILLDLPPPADGVVRGTAGADRIRGIQIDEVIRALGGDDVAWAGRGHDQVQGDGGNDLLFGQAGNDTLRGGTGADRLDGGTGRNALVGGSGADVFQFNQASVARIRDFEDGRDRLRIAEDLAPRFEDLGVTTFGASGQHTRLSYGGLVIELLDIGPAVIDAGDVVLVAA